MAQDSEKKDASIDQQYNLLLLSGDRMEITPFTFKGSSRVRLSFRKLACNLLLGVHPICINKWMHPILMCNIHNYYLNFQTVCKEYNTLDEFDYSDDDFKTITNINETLSYGVKNNSVQIVKWCIKIHVDIHINDNSALRISTVNGCLKNVRTLLSSNVYAHVLDDSLCIAADHGHAQIVQLLIDKGADVKSQDNQPLRYAAYNGHTKTVDVLLKAGADVHTRDDYPLRMAASNGHTEVVKLLINAGANIHAYYDSATTLAFDHKHMDIVQLLGNASNIE